MEARKRVLGQEHPDTLTSMANLAHTLHSIGRMDDAITMMTDAVTYLTSKLGVHHPDTIQSQLTLGAWKQVVRNSCIKQLSDS